MKHGRGVYEMPDGSKYDGQFVYDKMTGLAEYTWADGRR